MVRISKLAIEELVSKFSNKSLPKSEWNHQAHIIVGIWHNINYDYNTATELIRSKIKAYNIAVGTINSDDSGYHETLTIFWMTLTKAFLSHHPSSQIEELCRVFLQSEYASKSYPFKFYSREILFSKEAQKNWVDGNIKSTSSFNNIFIESKSSSPKSN